MNLAEGNAIIIKTINRFINQPTFSKAALTPAKFDEIHQIERINF